MTFRSVEEVVAHAKLLEGKEFERVHPIAKDAENDHKGGFGHLVESVHFGVEPNSRSGPDIEDLGVEIKTTPMKKLKRGGLKSKERLVLGIIDYHALIEESFLTSSFFRKNELILLVFYLHESGKRKAQLKTLVTGLLNLNEWDLGVMERDWELIQSKVKQGKAHLLSEGDTMFLAACTKGANAKSLRTQPNSEEKAMQRAFALKSSYLNVIYASFERRTKSTSTASIQAKGVEALHLEDHLAELNRWYRNLTAKEIASDLGGDFNENSKSFLHSLCIRMLTETKARSVEEFDKANIQLKTIRLKSDGTPKESMSFPSFKFRELVNESWVDSDFFELLDSKKFCFAVFQCQNKDCSGARVFKGFYLWNMPQSDISKAAKTWRLTKTLVRNGAIVKELKETKKGIERQTHFPAQKNTEVAHVRPHAQNAADVYPLPTADKLTGATAYTKHSFWLNADYLKKVIAGLQSVPNR